MTERLRQLLHEEAAELVVPLPPSREILAEGRRRRRRVRAGAVGVGLAAAAVATVVGLGVTAAPDHQGVDAAALQRFQTWGAVATGRDIVIGETTVTWDGDITAMYYTSQGVVVRSGGDYSLVRADGEISPVSVDIPDRVPGFEPDSTRFGYAAPVEGGGWDVVVHDAATDEELARVEVQGEAYGGWEAPPVAIDGDRAWIHLAGHWTEVAWRTGDVREVPGTQATYELTNGVYAVQSGPYVEGSQRGWEVRSWTDGALVGTVDLPREWYAFFSPDGRYLRAFSQDQETDDQPDRVYDTVTGESRDLPDVPSGWTPDGDLVLVDGGQIQVCPPMGGECRTRNFERTSGGLRIGGNPYES